jgi:hypothetical protein
VDRRAVHDAFRFQTFTMRDQQGASKQGGRLQLRSLSVRYSNTGTFRIDITAENRPVFSQTYGGLTLGDTNAAPVPAPHHQQGPSDARCQERPRYR